MYKRLLLILLLAAGCNTDDKPIDQVLNDVEYGAVVRTLQFNQAEFYVNQPDGIFSVDIEIQDELNGGLLERLDLYVSFVDNSGTTNSLVSQEFSAGSIPASDFGRQGNDGLPNLTLEFQFSDLAGIVGVPVGQIQCKDQFLLRVDLVLTDGRSFSTGSASSFIIAYETFFSSPYCYTINVVEPIDKDLYLGTYRYESLVDGPLGGPTFIPEGLVEVFKGHSNNVRYIPLKHLLSHPSNELPRNYYFTIACDESVFGKNQLSSVIAYCSVSGAPILLGPDEENAPINPLDDSVFELWLVEGYEGWDGECGFGTAPSRLRFTKQ
ncbi:hypothetical protein [Aureitalea marina]|uniref:Uncharacterized protein n=1 Tax=Aureitalea marina TaxID=930804 RepID=A0A2S7KPP3_9FLAO|nr:hypothetical protein [Aureitalea marina]PQB04599.1 hypothetical protein BST85_06575 [Aureitalea marina]